ncbi:MAG: GTPase domain-containing protein [Firmicutes bacterium]|nr:GTPase domain-containing protein [Alicyclobacillaceae bacterium]MCL6496885.1 GTPase domain-containing protein [Bacillota bacterium]
MEAVFVGRPNVGKSLLLINFCEYLGIRRLGPVDPHPKERMPTWTPAEARRRFVSAFPNRVLEPLAVAVSLVPGGHSGPTLVLRDTPGIPTGTVAEAAVRQAVAAGLGHLLGASLILHVVDATADPETDPQAQAVDAALWALARHLAPSVVVANKAETEGAVVAIRRLREQLGGPVLPVSAVTRLGFRDLKRWLWEQFQAARP